MTEVPHFDNFVQIYKICVIFSFSENIPFVSSVVQSKLLHRAVVLEDQKLLQKLINDVDHVCKVEQKK